MYNNFQTGVPDKDIFYSSNLSAFNLEKTNGFWEEIEVDGPHRFELRYLNARTMPVLEKPKVTSSREKKTNAAYFFPEI